MLTDEEIINIKRINDCFTKLIELNRMNFISTNNNLEMYKVFRDINKITSMEEKIIYLLCVYAVNCDESMMIILNDTGILCDEIVSNVIKNGIRENEIISPVLKEYIKSYTSRSLIDIIEDENKKILDINKKYNDGKYKAKVDYNISHLECETIKLAQHQNNKLKRKVRKTV